MLDRVNPDVKLTLTLKISSHPQQDTMAIAIIAIAIDGKFAPTCKSPVYVRVSLGTASELHSFSDFDF